MAEFASRTVVYWIAVVVIGFALALTARLMLARNIRKQITAEFGRHIPHAEIERLDEVVPDWLRVGMTMHTVGAVLIVGGGMFVVRAIIAVVTR